MVMGAHGAPLVRVPTLLKTKTRKTKTIFKRISIKTTTCSYNKPIKLYVSFILMLLVSSGVELVRSSPEPYAQSLLKFKSSLANADEALSDWKPSTDPCPQPGPDGQPGWNGVLCSDGGNIWGLQLESLRLSGQIDVDSLVALPLLRTLSIMNNQFEGPMPDFKKLGALKSLYLSDNQFSGPIADNAFEGMASLKKLHMANNKFTDNIPTSMAASPRLLELKLENNQFLGRIPDFPPTLKVLNVSNNNLEGPIPPALKNMDPASFSGTCGSFNFFLFVFLNERRITFFRVFIKGLR